MSLRVDYAPWFEADLHLRIAWYTEQSGLQLGERFVLAVHATIRKLAANPHLGQRPYPKDTEVADLYAVLLERPFNKHILYYRSTTETLIVERLIHGARDLPRRLRESPYESG
jgi:plasmid stabilization system protein ParE